MRALYKEIGDELRSAREYARLPLEEAARRLHIRIPYLEALENGDVGQLPGAAYARGYIHRYGVFLGLSGDELLHRLDGGTPEQRGFFLPRTWMAKTRPSRRIIIASALLTAFFLWYYAPPAPPPVMDPTPYMAPSAGKTPQNPCTARASLYPPCFWDPTDAPPNPPR